MAITAADYNLFRFLRERGQVQTGGSLLEIGEAEWYGDVTLDQLEEHVNQYAPLTHQAYWWNKILAARQALADIEDRFRGERQSPESLHRIGMVALQIAKVFWGVFLDPVCHQCIDLYGVASEDTHRADLNEPIGVAHFDVVANLGTAEHIFNIAQVFETMHENCRPGGLMIHQAPFRGWIDHGFYCLQPTLFWDLAAANDYQVVAAFYAEFEKGIDAVYALTDRRATAELIERGLLKKQTGMLLFALRRPEEQKPFRIPTQSVYAGADLETTAAWRQSRVAV